MAERLSRSEVDALGERLAAGPLVPADRNALDCLLLSYGEVLDDVEQRLREGLHPSITAHLASRVKTTGSIVEKLQRGVVGLATMHDVAGARIVVDVCRSTQDGLATSLAELFPADPKAARLVDRRAVPTAGYRAVHVVVMVGGLRCELQLRTRLQHLWAELLEACADRWGRHVRYGEQPDAGGAPAVEAVRRLADLVDAHERGVDARGPGTSTGVEAFLARSDVQRLLGVVGEDLAEAGVA